MDCHLHAYFVQLHLDILHYRLLYFLMENFVFTFENISCFSGFYSIVSLVFNLKDYIIKMPMPVPKSVFHELIQ